MDYLRRMFFKRFRKKLLLGSGILIVGIIALLAFRIQLNIDLGQILFGAAALLFVYILLLWAKYLMEPKKKVKVITRVKLTSPPTILKSVMTYKLRIETEHHIEDKGENRSVKMDELLLTFNNADHPDVYRHCLYLVSQHAESCMSLAEAKYPSAIVEKAPPLLPDALKERR